MSEVKKTKAVVSGVIRAATSDAKGNVLTIEILVGDGEEEPYLVADTPKGKELHRHVGEFVMVAGMVLEDDLGWKTIEVSNYTLTHDLKEK